MTQAIYTETYIRDPESPWLVFLHGFGGTAEMWKKQIPVFKEKFNLLLLDLPGHGRSQVGIAGRGARRFEDVADLVVEAIRGHGIEKACFVCLSLGTMVFAAIQNKYPELVTGAILCGAVAGVNRVMQCWLYVLNSIRHTFPYMFLLRMFAWILLPKKEHETSRKFFIKSGKKLGRKEFMAWFSLITNNMTVLKPIIHRLENALFISGTEDYTFLGKLKDLLRRRHNLRLSLLKRCGHVCNLQHPQEFNSISMEFLNENLLPETGTP